MSKGNFTTITNKEMEREGGRKKEGGIGYKIIK